MATVLTVNGQVVNLDMGRVSIQRVTLSVDEPDSLEFGEVGVSLPTTWREGMLATLSIDGQLYFNGEITSTHGGNIGEDAIATGYRAMGLAWRANRIPVTNPQDGTGTITFNLPSTDPNFIAQFSGQSVGQILTYLFNGHATALATVGVLGFLASDLTALTIVPNEPVVIRGSRFWNSVVDFVQDWYAQFVPYIPANGIIRVRDSTAFTPTTYTLDSDPITLDSYSRDTSQCYTRVCLRGYAEIEPAYLSLAMGTLSEAFTTANKLAWTWYSFVQPTGAIDSGTITALTSTQVTIQSSNASETFIVNYWAGIESQIQLINAAATNISFTEARQIIANTPMSPGGTSVITFDQPLVNSGYTQYYIYGQPPGVSNTWRLYNIVPQYVAQHLVKQFSHSVPWGTTSSAVVQTNFPAANICWSPNGQKPFIEFPSTFEVMPATGQIRFTEPVVKVFGTLTNLQKGGDSTDGIPDDIKVLVPYSRGAIQTVCPADLYGVPQYQGTAYTVDGIERTLYRDYPQWVWANDTPSYQQLACQILLTVCNILVEGQLTWWGKNLTPLTLGTSVNVARVGGTTGLEAVNAAVRSVSLEYPQSGPTNWITRLSFSTVRRPFSGDTLYAHPMFAAHTGDYASIGAGALSVQGSAIGDMGALAGQAAAGMSGASEGASSAMSGISSGMGQAMSDASSNAGNAMSAMSGGAADSMSAMAQGSGAPGDVDPTTIAMPLGGNGLKGAGGNDANARAVPFGQGTLPSSGSFDASSLPADQQGPGFHDVDDGGTATASRFAKQRDDG